jgi:hypothetical protein
MTDQAVTEQPQVEKINAEDKTLLDASIANKDKALMTAKLAIAQSETAAVNHDNFVLRLALKYSLNDQDTIDNITGIITRKSK